MLVDWPLIRVILIIINKRKIYQEGAVTKMKTRRQIHQVEDKGLIHGEPSICSRKVSPNVLLFLIAQTMFQKGTA